MIEEGEVSYLPPWKNAAFLLFGGKYNFGDVITHEELNASLGMVEPTTTADAYKQWSLKRIPQIDALSQWLLEEKNMCLASVHGQGYRIVPPQEQTEFAQEVGMKVVRREIGKMVRRLHYVDRSRLTHDQARENANAMARAAFLKQQIKKTARLSFEAPEVEGLN